MTHSSPTRRPAGWCLLLGALPLLLATCTVRETSNMPTPPDPVRTATQQVDAAFAQGHGAPLAFRKSAAEAVPKLRIALFAWSNDAQGVDVRSRIRGWSIMAGQIETSVGALPPRPTSEDCRPVLEAWQALRAQLP
jgi:hypothetical protein